jgi:hypothetical protein
VAGSNAFRIGGKVLAIWSWQICQLHPKTQGLFSIPLHTTMATETSKSRIPSHTCRSVAKPFIIYLIIIYIYLAVYPSCIMLYLLVNKEPKKPPLFGDIQVVHHQGARPSSCLAPLLQVENVHPHRPAPNEPGLLPRPGEFSRHPNYFRSTLEF